MSQELQRYVPEAAFSQVKALLEYDNLKVIVKNERKTRHGDYRRLPNNQHQITVNNNLNSYRFLITLLHEIAHFEAYKTFGKHIKPHGIEWKQTFQHIMLPFLQPNVFTHHLLPLLAKHFKNPKASSDTDVVLSAALKKYDPKSDFVFVSELALETPFKMQNGRQFKRGIVRRKRIECIEISSGKTYLFHPNAEVLVLS